MAFLDRVIFNASASGTADFVVASAVTGYQSPSAAGAVNGSTYSYAAELRDSSGNIQAWEVGQGAWTAASSTLARTTVLFSSNSGSKVNFASPPNVMVTALAEDFGAVAGTSGSVLFAGANGAPAQDNTNFFWDNSGKSLKLASNMEFKGTSATIHITGGSGGMRLSGNSIGGTSDGTGFLMSLGYNTANNKQYWLGDPDYIGNASGIFLRVLTINGKSALSAIDGNNSVTKPVVIDSGTFLEVDNYQYFATLAPVVYFNNNGPTYFGTIACTQNSGVSSAIAFGRASSVGGAATNQIFAICETGILSFGGLTSSFPGIVNSGAKLVCKLADNSADADFQAKTVQTDVFTVATLPTAGTKGRRAFVSDANATTYASIVAGGGANNIPVYDDGTNWRIG